MLLVFSFSSMAPCYYYISFSKQMNYMIKNLKLKIEVYQHNTDTYFLSLFKL